MFTNAKSTYDRAVANAQRLGHAQVGNTHLLLGILALGNHDRTSPIPRLLRDTGADYETLRIFLESRVELLREGRTSVPPTADEELTRTLARAARIAKRRVRKDGARAIITEDLLISLLDSHDQLLVMALRKMHVDKSALRRRLVDTRKSMVRSRHLELVNN